LTLRQLPLRINGYFMNQTLIVSLRHLALSVVLGLGAFSSGSSAFAVEALDPALRPESIQGNASRVFNDMGVVQRKAMSKDERFLLSTYGSFDFSDGPYTNYSINVNPGFALSDFLEVYVNYAPSFLVSARPIVQTVRRLQFEDGSPAMLVSPRPRSQLGLELLWAPAYGKDSLGMHRVIRSDTFLKFGVSRIQFDGDSGLKYVAGVGKTYFMGRSLGFRICIDYSYMQTILNNLKQFQSIVFAEAGLVLYI